jgi:CRP/FNR family transcriptional regulator
MPDTICHYEAGERILSIGEPATQAYMIRSGKVRVYLKKDGKTVDLALLGPGEIFGEAALFKGGEYGANVDAIENLDVAIITPETLEAMMSSSHPFIRALISMLGERLKQTNTRLVKSETREFIDIGFA